MSIFKKIVKYGSNTAFDTRTSQPLTTQEDAWKASADCGCGIDCCDREIVMTDKETGIVSKLYFKNGSLYKQVGANAEVLIG